MIRDHYRTGLLSLAIALAAMLPLYAQSVPEPSLVPRSWQLEIKYQTPRPIKVVIPGESAPRVYWFWTYTVTNRTGEDRIFVPEISMLTNAGDYMHANRNIPPTVFKAIKNKLRNPLLMSQAEIIGKILQGPDHAVDGVAIWEMPGHDVDHTRVFFNGLSGETYEVEDPKSGETKLLRKSLLVEYDLPGSAKQPEQPWIYRRQQWVVR